VHTWVRLNFKLWKVFFFFFTKVDIKFVFILKQIFDYLSFFLCYLNPHFLLCCFFIIFKFKHCMFYHFRDCYTKTLTRQNLLNSTVILFVINIQVFSSSKTYLTPQLYYLSSSLLINTFLCLTLFFDECFKLFEYSEDLYFLFFFLQLNKPNSF